MTPEQATELLLYVKVIYIMIAAITGITVGKFFGGMLASILGAK